MPFSQAAVDDSLETITALKKEGTLLRLKADYEGANKISARLKQLFPEQAIGYTMNLNTLVTRLSWDGQQTQYDESILRDSKKALSLCNAQIKENWLFVFWRKNLNFFEILHDYGTLHIVPRPHNTI